MVLDKGDLGTTEEHVEWSVRGTVGLRRGCGQWRLSEQRRSPKLQEMWVCPEGMEEQGISTVLLRTPQGTVRNGSPQLHLDPGRPVSWVGSGHGLFAGFLGDTKQEGLGPDLVNSNSEDLRRVGRTVRHGELPWLTASLPPTPQLH